ncbi:MAG: cytochrome C [Deltaproteobacteria bacterium]|nr:cytochrome C [Deltaproteobacteria bacterium]
MSVARTSLGLLTVASWLALAPRAEAVPSFARQTGFSCAQCHTQFPELTAFGRAFKASGYTMTMAKTVSDKRDERTVLEFLEAAPVSAMVQASTTTIAQQEPGAAGPTYKTDAVLPQQLSVFYAGKLAPEVGAFIQLTYDGVEDHFGMDNTDIRWAHTTTVGDKGLVYGLSLNNNPTVTDLYHGVPAWSWPFAASGVAPTPTAAPLIAGGLAQSVAGLNGYAQWNGMVYLEGGVYRSAPLGVARPLGIDTSATGVISGVAPYWRLAVEKDFDQSSIEVGTYGLEARLFPGGELPLAGPTDGYVDIAFDAQYQYVGPDHIFTANAYFIHESQNLLATAATGGSENVNDSLNALNVSAGYIYHRLIGVRAGYQSVLGTNDVGLYAPAPVSGSNNGAPNSTDFIGELDFTPWLNTKFSLQYTTYFSFNGASTNYDGSGRDASANNTLYALAWIAF